MTPVKIIALVFVVFALVKLVVVSVKPASWKSVVHSVYVKPPYTILLAALAAVIILHYLLMELTIVQVFASMTFMAALMMIQFACLGEEGQEIADKFLDDRKILKKMWFPLVIWIALMIWALFEIFS